VAKAPTNPALGNATINNFSSGISSELIIDYNMKKQNKSYKLDFQ
jgi:hypothetical protein